MKKIVLGLVIGVIVLGCESKEERLVRLIKELKNENWRVRSNAAHTLGKMPDKRAVKPLIEVLKDEHKWVRTDAAWALGKMQDKSAVGPLIEALKDKDEDVRSSARDALKNMTGKNLGRDYNQWKRWYEENQK